MKKKRKVTKRKKFNWGGIPYNLPEELISEQGIPNLLKAHQDPISLSSIPLPTSITTPDAKAPTLTKQTPIKAGINPGDKPSGQGLGKASMGLGMVSGTISNVLEGTLVDTDKMKGGAKGVYTGAKMAGDVLSQSPEPISNLIGQGIKILTPALAGLGQKIKAKRQNLDPEYEQGNSNLFTTGHFGFAHGGKIPFDTSQLIEFKGPKHENGGIPIDFDQDGIEESEVEGNETMKDGYVFSDQLGYDKNKNLTTDKSKVKTTFAKESKKIENKFKGRFDETSQFTKELEMKKLQNHNEVVRKKVDSKKQKGFQREKFNTGGKPNLRDLPPPDDLTPAYNKPIPPAPRFDNPLLGVSPLNNHDITTNLQKSIGILNPSGINPKSRYEEETNNLKRLNVIDNAKMQRGTEVNNKPVPFIGSPALNSSNQTPVKPPLYNYNQSLQQFQGKGRPTTPTQQPTSNKPVTTTNPTPKSNSKPATTPKSTGLKYDENVAKWQQEMLNLGYTPADMGFKDKPDGLMGNKSNALLARLTADDSVDKDRTNPVGLPEHTFNDKTFTPLPFDAKPEDLFQLTKKQLRDEKRNGRNNENKGNGFGDLTTGDKIQLGAAFANYGSKLAQSMKKLDKEPVWTNQNEAAALAKVENLKTDTRQAKNELQRSVEAGKQTIAANSRSVGNMLANNQALANKEMGARNELSIKEMEFDNNKKLQLANMITQFGEINKQERKQAYINRQQNKAARDMMRADANNKLESALSALGQAKNVSKLNTMQFNMIKEMSKEFGYGTDYKSFLKDINGAGLLEYLGQPLDTKSTGNGTAQSTAKKVQDKKNKKGGE